MNGDGHSETRRACALVARCLPVCAGRLSIAIQCGRWGGALLVAMLLIFCAGAAPDAMAKGPVGQHDMLLLLPDGPVHLRIEISDGGRSLQQMRDDYLAHLVESLDADQDGKLSRSETTKHPLFAKGRRFQGNKFLNSLRSRRPYTNHEIAMAVDREAGQLVSYRQNNLLADQDLSVFSVLDADSSGQIDRLEMRLAPARIGERDSDFDQCVTFDEFLNEADAMASPLIVNPFDEEPPGAVNSELLRDATEPILAGRLVRRYDSDRDSHLSPEELGWQSERVEQIDSDGDSRLSLHELAQLASAQPDISLRVDLSKEPAAAMEVVGESSPGVDVSRSDLIRLDRAGLSLSVGYRASRPHAGSQAERRSCLQCHRRGRQRVSRSRRDRRTPKIRALPVRCDGSRRR